MGNIAGNINYPKKEKIAQYLRETKKGEVYENLEIIDFYPVRPESETRYDSLKNMPWCKCKCLVCDSECVYPWYMVKTGLIRSCGCLAQINYKKVREENMIRLTFNGETLTIKEWADKRGISVSAIRYRMKNGKPIDEVLAMKKENPYDTSSK